MTRNSRAAGQSLLLIMTSKSHLLHTEMSLHNELEQIMSDSLSESDSFSESEVLTDTSLSAYDCDSEGEATRNDIDSEDSDDKMRGTCKPGVMGLKFQLDAAKAGEHRNFHPEDSTVNCVM